MFIGVLSLDLSIAYTETVKEKRNVIRSIKDTVRKKFNVSVSDVSNGEYNDFRARIAIVGVSSDANYLQSNFSNIINLLEDLYQEYILSHSLEILSYFPDEELQ
mgnify:CR=1 FL=1